MKKILTSVSILVLVLVLAVISLGPGGITGAIVADAEVGSEIVNAFDQGQEEVSVIVLLKDAPAELGNEQKQREAIKHQQQEVLENLRQEEGKNIFGLTQEKEFELGYQYETLNALAGEVTEAGLDKLRNDPYVDQIIVNKERQLFLSGSVPVVNADDAWNVVVNGHNITGEGETVCVIDTGVDYNHTALAGNYVSGYDFYNNDSDPMDDQGHGTHVAGIVASTDTTFRGVAPGAKIAAVKVCSSSGSCPDADVLAGMDWCIANKDIYNISVISISLGGGSYASYCDNEVDFAPYAAAINSAVGKNISVVAATGNSGAGSIAGPACVQNATRVTAATKEDALPGYASRHAFFTDTLAAPGSAITSLKKSGGTVTMSGTSMATPHVSGVITLIKQYWKQAYGTIPTPEQLEQKLISSGKSIYDSSTNTALARVDVLAALQPILSYETVPQNNSVLNSTAVSVSISSDVDLAQAWLQWMYPNGSIQNLTLADTTLTLADTSSMQYSIELTTLDKGTHSYQAYGSDSVGTIGAAVPQSFTIDNIAPSVSLVAPSVNTTIDDDLYNFTAKVDDEHSSVSAVWFNLSGGNNSFLYPALQNTITANDSNSTDSDIWISQVNLSELADGSYTVTVYANDSLNNENNSEAITFTIGPIPLETFLNAQVVKPVVGDVYKTELVVVNATINSSHTISTVTFKITNVSGSISLLAVPNNSSAWIAQVNMSTLAEENHTLTVIALDIFGKVNGTVSVQFNIDRTGPFLNAITESNVNESSAKIQWSTDEAADAKVHYGTSTSLGTEVVLSGNDTAAHEVTLVNLASSILYYYSVASCDAVDNCNSSGLRNFTTTAALQPPPDEDDEEEDDNSSSESSSDSSSGSSGGSSGSSGGSSSSSSSSSSEELAEVEEEVIEEAPEETELQIAQTESNTEESQAEELQTAEDKIAVTGDNSEDGKGFSNLLTGFASAVTSVELSSKEYVLAGLTALAVILTIAFIVIRKREQEY